VSVTYLTNVISKKIASNLYGEKLLKIVVSCFLFSLTYLYMHPFLFSTSIWCLS